MPDDIYKQEYVIDVTTEGAEEARKQLEDLDKQVEDVKSKLSDPFDIPDINLSDYISGDIKNLTAEFYDFQEIVNDSSTTFEGMSAQIQLIQNDLDSLTHIEGATAEQQESINGLISMYSGLLIEAKDRLAGMTSEIQQETSAVEGLSQAMREATTESDELPDTYEELAERFQYVQEEAEAMRFAIRDMVKEIGNSEPSPEQSAELQYRLKQYQELLALLEQIKQKMAELGLQQVSTGKTIEISFKGMINSLKKYGLALLGVRSTFMVFRRAVNNALSNNVDLANKMNAVWTALGNAVAPVVEKFVNGLLTILAYFNIFLKAVSGGKIDLLASTSKGAKSTAKSLKEANKQLAGFDELANINENNGSGGTGGGIDGFADAFKDVEINTEWADKIQRFGEWFRDNWGIVVGGLLGTYEAIKLLVKGADLLYAVGTGLIIAGVVEVFQGIVDAVNGIKTDNLDLFAKGLQEIALGIAIISVGIAILNNSWSGLWGLVIAGVVLLASWVIKHWDEIKYAFTECVESMKDNWEVFKQKVSDVATAIWTWITEKWDGIKYAFSECVDSMKSHWDAFKTKVHDIATAIWEWLCGIWDGIASYFGEKITKMKTDFENLKLKVVTVATDLKNGIVERWEQIKYAFSECVDSMKSHWDALKKKASDVVTSIKDNIKEKINNVISVVEGAINGIINGVNSLIRAINRISFTTP